MDSSVGPRIARILLTGPPGIGKTTVCKKLVALLSETRFSVDGFYTEEVRSVDGNRIGFDIVSLRNSHDRRPLARTGESLSGRKSSKARVGNYHVFVDDFETAALPIFDSRTDVLLIDEIGKMELFSGKFEDSVEKLFLAEPREKPVCVVATIPQKHKVPPRFAKFFDKLLDDNVACKVMEVDRRSRNDLPETIARSIKSIISS